MHYNSKKGAVTVEAALTLPIFICAVIAIAFIMRLVYIHETVQHALNETAEEMASYSYIYHISGIQELHDTSRDEMKVDAEKLEEQLSNILGLQDCLRGLPEDTSENGQQIQDAEVNPGVEDIGLQPNPLDDWMESANGNFKNTLEDLWKYMQDPKQVLKGIACKVVLGAFEDLKTDVCVPAVKYHMAQCFRGGGVLKEDNSLSSLHIVGGFDGFDFSQSSFFSDEENNIDIIIRYKVRVPVPFHLLPEISFEQRAVSKAWLGGDEDTGVNSVEEDIWSLDNFQRGNAIRKKFGANLPHNFPVLSTFSSGEATVIKSMDLTASSYQQHNQIRKQIEQYIKKLMDFEGQEEPWGSKGIVIHGIDIKTKKLLLVIPQNKLSAETEEVLSECIRIAAAKGIKLVIERFGMKKLKE